MLYGSITAVTSLLPLQKMLFITFNIEQGQFNFKFIALQNLSTVSVGPPNRVLKPLFLCGYETRRYEWTLASVSLLNQKQLARRSFMLIPWSNTFVTLFMLLPHTLALLSLICHPIFLHYPRSHPEIKQLHLQSSMPTPTAPPLPPRIEPQPQYIHQVSALNLLSGAWLYINSNMLAQEGRWIVLDCFLLFLCLLITVTLLPSAFMVAESLCLFRRMLKMCAWLLIVMTTIKVGGRGVVAAAASVNSQCVCHSWHCLW